MKPRGQLQKENDQKFLAMLKEYKREGKASDHGVYDMLQEYMIENELLRLVMSLGLHVCLELEVH